METQRQSQIISVRSACPGSRLSPPPPDPLSAKPTATHSGLPWPLPESQHFQALQGPWNRKKKKNGPEPVFDGFGINLTAVGM